MTNQGPRQERTVAEDRRQERLARRLGLDGAAWLGDRRAGGAEGVVPLGEAQLGEPGIGRFGYRSGPVEECETVPLESLLPAPRACRSRERAARRTAFPGAMIGVARSMRIHAPLATVREWSG